MNGLGNLWVKTSSSQAGWQAITASSLQRQGMWACILRFPYSETLRRESIPLEQLMQKIFPGSKNVGITASYVVLSASLCKLKHIMLVLQYRACHIQRQIAKSAFQYNSSISGSLAVP